MTLFPISEIQKKLSETALDGWLMYDFKGRNRVGLSILDVPFETFLTRPFYCWVPKQGSAISIVHEIDAPYLRHLPGKLILYSSAHEQEKALLSILKKGTTIAMEYWPTHTLPSQAILDASTKEWIESFGTIVTSSWPLISEFVGQLTPLQKNQHKEAATILTNTFQLAWQWVSKHLHDHKSITEQDLQTYVIGLLKENGATSDSPPIVAVGKNSAIQHHIPGKTLITKDSVLLLDIWCALEKENAPYADFTQMAFTGKTPPIILSKIFGIVRDAQQEALTFIDTCLQNNCTIAGSEVDDVCRNRIKMHGFDQYFTHRTGHNIHCSVHGPGANLDNYETLDSRLLIQNGCYAIEPGIYIKDAFGIRLECNILIESPSCTTISNKGPESILCIG